MKKQILTIMVGAVVMHSRAWLGFPVATRFTSLAPDRHRVDPGQDGKAARSPRDLTALRPVQIFIQKTTRQRTSDTGPPFERARTASVWLAGRFKLASAK